MKNRIFLTGASGFVGKNILSGLINKDDQDILLLEHKTTIPLAENNNVKILRGHLADIETIKSEIRSFAPKVCIHCAWEGIPDYSATVSKANLLNSIALIDFLYNETPCKKIIFSGSCFEYGKTNGLCNESDSVKPGSYFAWAKQSLYNYASLGGDKSGITVIWFRIFYVYGRFQRPGSLIPMLVRSFKKNTAPDIRNPLNANDFVFAGDVARAFVMATEKDMPAGIYNLGSGVSTRLIDVCRIIEENIRGDSRISDEIEKNTCCKQIVNFWADTSKTKKILNWSAQTGIASGIQEYVDKQGD